MSRQAIIIESSNIKGEADLPGAREDADNWIKFLKSNLGGSWSDSEIKRLSKPSSTTLDIWLNLYRDRYCFIAFSGHGRHSTKANETYVCLNDSDRDYPISRLKPRGSKGTLIVDACRGTEDGKRAVITEATAMNEVLDVANALRDRGQIVKLSASVLESQGYKWRNYLRDDALNGIVTMYSCNVGEGAGEYEVGDPKKGGYYSSTLIAVAEQWSRKSYSSGIYTTKQAHDDTVTYFQTAFPQQNPQYEPLYLRFPFAVE
jgi:hypothetical protein